MPLEGIAHTIIWVIVIIILVVVLVYVVTALLFVVTPFTMVDVQGAIDLDSDNMEYNLDPGRIITIIGEPD